MGAAASRRDLHHAYAQHLTESPTTMTGSHFGEPRMTPTSCPGPTSPCGWPPRTRPPRIKATEDRVARIEPYLDQGGSAALRRDPASAPGLCLDGPPAHAGSARAAGHLIHMAHLATHQSVSDA